MLVDRWGEIRDAETAGIAVNTALTGHLLLSTLHTSDSATTLPRLLDMGIDAYLVASTVNIAIGQRLVRKICPHCKEEYTLLPGEAESLSHTLPGGMLLPTGDVEPLPTFYHGRGCDACGGSGYQGRVGINEVLVVDADIRDAILRKASATVSITISESPENTPTLCSDTTDNDNDTLVDLADPDCADFIPTLKVIKLVVNDNGTGSATSSDFTITVTGTSVGTPTFPGSVAGSSTTLGLGSYSVSETGPSGYTASMSAGCSGTITAGENKVCTITNDDNAPAPAPTPSGGGGGGGGTITSGPLSIGFVNTNPGGLVLGAATEEMCGEYISSYMRMGRKNDPEQVKKLQIFLNKEMGSNLPVTGFFGGLTKAAVEQFQLKYSSEVLKPWVPHGLPSEKVPTGYVYKTTKRWINLIECASLNTPLPQLP